MIGTSLAPIVCSSLSASINGRAHLHSFRVFILRFANFPAVSHNVPDNQPLPFPFTQAAQPVPASSLPDTTLPSTDPNYQSAVRGKYLAANIGICMECHTKHTQGTPIPLDTTKLFADETTAPVLDPALDKRILSNYHKTMDERGAGNSRTGRKLFSWLPSAGLEILAAGSSDWMVFPQAGKYPADEAYFLHHILYFFEQSLTGREGLDGQQLAGWLEQRHAQVERGELIYVAHQIDFLARQAQR